VLLRALSFIHTLNFESLVHIFLSVQEVDEFMAILGQVLWTLGGRVGQCVVPLLAEPVVAGGCVIHTYDPTSTFLALDLWILRVFVEVEVKENTWGINPFLARHPGIKLVKIDRVFATERFRKA